MNIAIIPARVGSKRIPKKNIKIFCGKPIIALTIKNLIDSNCFDRIIVSTDSDEIKDIATKAGAEVPFKRPEDLSDDFTPTLPVIQHAINELNLQKSDSKICCVYATAPFLKSNYLIEGLELLKLNDKNFVFSATKFPSNVERGFYVNHENISIIDEVGQRKRSQDIKEIWYDAGQFYWGTTSSWLSNKEIVSNDSKIINIPRKFTCDIDTPEDWDFAEILYKAMFLIK